VDIMVARYQSSSHLSLGALPPGSASFSRLMRALSLTSTAERYARIRTARRHLTRQYQRLQVRLQRSIQTIHRIDLPQLNFVPFNLR
jgi:hypothetical protein